MNQQSTLASKTIPAIGLHVAALTAAFAGSASTALDLGPAGRDTKYGYGLVQAKAAYDRIKSLGCGK